MEWLVKPPPSPPPPPISGESKHERNLKSVGDIMAEIKATSLDRYLTVITTLWHCWYF